MLFFFPRVVHVTANSCSFTWLKEKSAFCAPPQRSQITNTGSPWCDTYLLQTNKKKYRFFLAFPVLFFFFFFTMHTHTTPSTRGAAFCCETAMERDLLEVVSLRWNGDQTASFTDDIIYCVGCRWGCGDHGRICAGPHHCVLYRLQEPSQRAFLTCCY